MDHMNPWLMEKLMQARVADLHRNAKRESAGRAEPLLAVGPDVRAASSSRLRHSLGRLLVRTGNRVGGFDVQAAQTICGPLTSYR